MAAPVPERRMTAIDEAGGLVVVDDVSHSFSKGDERLLVLSEIDLTIAAGEFVAVVGRSGCGKSTLLNIMAGLLTPTTGDVRVVAAPRDSGLPSIGYITQHDSLLPWRTAIRNVTFPLELHGVGKRERLAVGRELLAKVGLNGFEDRLPHELSGGMRQRLSLARTLLYRPQVLLMDEPFAALDAEMRGALQSLLLDLWADTGTTVVFVTHDLIEAITLADRVVSLDSSPGRIRGVHAVDIDRPRDVEQLRFDPQAGELYAVLRAELGVPAASEVL